jgi:hypothetical protein
LKALPKLLTKLNLYLKLAISLRRLEFALFRILCGVLNEASVFLTNQQLSDDLKTLTRLIFTISMISQSSGDFRFKNELDTVELVFIDERTAELVHSDVLTCIINS